MPLDGVFLHHLRAELRAQLLGARVDKIHSPAKDEFVLHLRTRTERHKLLLCVNPARARVNITTQDLENPAQPTMFCMLLRKHLTGARLADIRQAENLDRILYFDFDGTDMLGNPAKHTLCAELTGRRANLLLLGEDGTILDAAKRVDYSQSTRALLPGIPYTPPPANNYTPPPITGRPERAESLSRQLELCYQEKDQAQRAKQRVRELLKLCEARAQRARRRTEAQRQELAQAQNREHLRVCAELIFANRARLENDPTARGGTAYLLENYYKR